MKNLAIIPARSGSKGLKDKNIKLLNGKPLLRYAIEAANQSDIFDEIYVSTDSIEYAEIAMQSGASVPFLRDENNATDIASSWDVVREAINKYQTIGKTFDMVCLLQPTTPLRNANDIKNAYALMKSKQAKSIVSVCEADHSPLWYNTLPEDFNMKDFIRKEVACLPRQQLSTYYRINGAIYMIETEHLLTESSIYEHGCFAYLMDKKRSVDIDDDFDFWLAEKIMEVL